MPLFHFIQFIMPPKKPRKPRNSPEKYRAIGNAHKNRRLNLWEVENMVKAIQEYKELKAINPGQEKAPIAKKYGIPTVTFWKRVTDRVHGTGYRSGGARRPRVLKKGMAISLEFHLITPLLQVTHFT